MKTLTVSGVNEKGLGRPSSLHRLQAVKRISKFSE